MRDFFGKKTLKKVYYMLENLKEYLHKNETINKIENNKKLIQDCEKPKNIIYIIKRNAEAGFFSNYFFVLGHLIVAYKNNWIPIVDMENYKTPYNEENEVDGTLNAWEYYFYQPKGKSLKQIGKCDKVYISSDDYPIGIVPSYGILISDIPSKETIETIGEFLPRIKDNLVSEFTTEINELQIESCIGVHVRGTDMKSTDAHPIPPTVYEVFDRIDRLFEKIGKMPIYLCTDEANIISIFVEKYGDVRFSDSYRSTDGIEGIHLERKKVNRENHKYLLGKEVLRDVFCLAHCKCLIAGKSNVAFAAMIMNGNAYDYMIIDGELREKRIK